MKILITGGLGFIFSHVCEALVSKDHSVTIIDALLDGSNPSLISDFEKAGMKIIKKRCEDISEIDVDNDFDLIIHAAAESNVDKSISDVDSFVSSNINGTINMLNVAKRQKALKSFIYVSTDEVHGSSKDVQNGMTIRPMNPYAASKAAAGHFVWAFSNTYKIPVQEIRMCNVIGKRQANTKILPKSIELINSGESVPIYGNGFATREYIDVRDVCKSFLYLIENHAQIRGNSQTDYTQKFGKPFMDNLHLITWNQELSILEILSLVSRITGKPFKTIGAERLGHDLHYRMNSTILPAIALNQSAIPIEETIKWMTT
jgi:dTDP-glucose 4,6-dehydratase